MRCIIKTLFTRIAIFFFAVTTAFYSLYVSSRGRIYVEMVEPDGLGRLLSEVASFLGRNGIADMLSRLRFADFFLALLFFLFICFSGEICFEGRKRTCLRRYTVKLITPVLIISAFLWVAFRFNNTSLFAWSDWIRGNNGYPLFGTARTVRKDEFVLWTPMALSQEALGWPGVNTLIGNGTDVTWISMGGLPAWNAALLFKPLYWGFLILGFDRGLSLLCICRLGLLFIVSRKTALLYTGQNQSMSFAAAAILTLSPMVQWFISQSIAEVLIFGQGMILAMNSLVKSSNTRTSVRYALLNSWLLGCLIMVGYPAWIIPMVYLILVVGIYQFSHASEKNRKQKVLGLLIALLPVLAMLGVIVYNSWDTLQAIRSSVYPGNRLITGGMRDDNLTGSVWNSSFKIGLSSIFFPLGKMKFNISNVCDVSPFLGFAPAGVVLSIEHQCRERKPDPFSIIVISMMAFFWLFTFVEMPAWFCKITLLSQCSRPVFPIGLCEVILLVRARAKGGIQDIRIAFTAVIISTAINVAAILYFRIIRPRATQLLILTVLYLFVFLLIYLDSREYGNRLTAFFISCILLLAGGFVNPVQQGIDFLDDYALVNTLKAIENEPDDLYALEGRYPLSNVPLMAGKHCINTDQPYADMKRWSAIDPERKFEDVYNRLCHVAIDLAKPGEETSFREDGNYILLRLTWEDLAALGVNYLITPRSSVDNARLVSYDDTDNLYIWKLE